MGKRWLTATAPLVCGALLSAACGGSDDRREERAVESLQGRSTVGTSLTLTGCVQSGALETAYVLENVRTSAPQQQNQQQNRPQNEQQSAPGDRYSDRTGSTITEGSSVQLQAANTADLRQYVGQQVRVIGTLIDSGANTIGTGGAKGQQVPSGDKSKASATELSNAEKKAQEAGPIARSTMANGTAPIIRVQQIEATGQPCTGGQKPIGRDDEKR